MRHTGIFYFAMVIACMGISCKPSPPPSPDSFTFTLQGADVSYLPELRQSKLLLLNANGQAEDPLQTLKNAGVNCIRLRLWKDPMDATSGFETVKALCSEAKALGIQTLISVHYSDSWADPSKQGKPAVWNNLNLQSLKDSMYAYTRKIVQEMNPDYIQIGNEINNGLVWPEGHYSNPAQMAELLQTGIQAVRDENPKTKIILHYAGYVGAHMYFNQIRNLNFDIIGLSYYPLWHGKRMDSLELALTDLQSTFGKKVMIAETAYPFTLGWNDYTHNIVGLQEQLIPGFEATPAGQQQYLMALYQTLRRVPNAIGFCYWGAEWVSYKGPTAGNGSSWENQALWDFSNIALPALTVYKNR